MGLSAISLFSGAGGLDLAAKWAGIRTVCYVEWDRYAQAVLVSRMRDGGLDEAPLWDDVTTFDGKAWRGKVDIVFGGFPCQPHSVAGKRGGADDARNLWPDTMRILRECGAWGFVGENVPGIVHNGYAAEVMADLEREGFCGDVFSNTACASGAPHMRERMFFVAHSASLYKFDHRLWGGNMESNGTKNLWEEFDPAGGGVVDGVAYGPHRARCCGNGVVPSEAVPAFEKLISWLPKKSSKRAAK